MPLLLAALLLTANPDRSTARLRVGLGGGRVSEMLGAAPATYGALLTVAKPLWLGKRYRHLQLTLDAFFAAGVGAARAPRVTLQTLIEPGIDLFLGDDLGISLRDGIGFACGPSSGITGLGFALLLEAALFVRPFSDDRHRLKLGWTFMIGRLINTNEVPMTWALVFAWEVPFSDR